jgi:uncharacterized protein YjiK
MPGVAVHTGTAQTQELRLRKERTIGAREFGVADLIGLAYSPVDGTLMLLDAKQTVGLATRAVKITTLADRVGTSEVAPLVVDPPNLAFDGRAGRLIAFDAMAGELSAAGPSDDGHTWITAANRDLGEFAVDRPQGLAVDQAADQLLVLDASSSRVVGIPLDSRAKPRFTIDLAALRGVQLRGLAINAAAGRLYVFGEHSRALYEISMAGQVIATYDLAPYGVVDLRGMVFAPSGDPTDEPATLNLYIADGGGGGPLDSSQMSGRIIELALRAPPPVTASETAPLVRTLDTSLWSPPSPDPSGITYLPASGRLLVSDGEVDEMREYFTGDNVFESSLSGQLLATHSTIAFSNEPTDVTIDPESGHWFFSHDGHRTIYEVDLGSDGAFGTSDDRLTSFSTRPFNCVDPEGLAFGDGKLFISDGLGKEIFIVEPGENGRFDGVAPAGDDKVSHFDTSQIGQPDPEGVEFNPDTGTLFIVSNDHHAVVTEATMSGELIRIIDISSLSAHSPAGVAYAPGSQDPSSRSLYIVDRGIDNGDDPDENDGKIFEISLGVRPPTRTPTPTARVTPTATVRATPTRTPNPAPTPTQRATPSSQPAVFVPVARR